MASRMIPGLVLLRELEVFVKLVSVLDKWNVICDGMATEMSGAKYEPAGWDRLQWTFWLTESVPGIVNRWPPIKRPEFRTLHDLRNYSQKKTFSIDNVLIHNSGKLANEFNTFLVSIGHNLAKYITCNVNPLFYVNSGNDSIVFQYVSVAQVRNVITSLKESTPGWNPFVMIQFVDTHV